MEDFQLKNNIKLFLEGKLSKDGEQKLLKWIKQTPENKNHFYKIQQKLGEEMVLQSDEKIIQPWKQILGRIEVDKNGAVQKIFKLTKFYRLAAPLAAAFIIGAFITSIILWNIGLPSKMTVTMQKIVAPYGARTQFILPDSSMVWLNSGSELSFPSEFGEKRPVTLLGEAYFEVKKSDIPFIVSTNYGVVEVKGTSFDVKAYSEDIFETTLVTGKVHILAENNDEATLTPGLQAIYSDNQLKVSPVKTEIYISWIEGKLIFQKEQLPQLVKKLERWYNVKIELENDPRLNKIDYTGTIEMETFSEVLNLLCITAPVDYTWNEKTRVIKLFFKNKGTK